MEVRFVISIIWDILIFNLIFDFDCVFTSILSLVRGLYPFTSLDVAGPNPDGRIFTLARIR
jgi:hypothetical protein